MWGAARLAGSATLSRLSVAQDFRSPNQGNRLATHSQNFATPTRENLHINNDPPVDDDAGMSTCHSLRHRLVWNTDFIPSQSYRQNEYVYTHPIAIPNCFRCRCPLFPAPDFPIARRTPQPFSCNCTAVVPAHVFEHVFLEIYTWLIRDSCADSQSQPRVPPASASGMFHVPSESSAGRQNTDSYFQPQQDPRSLQTLRVSRYKPHGSDERDETVGLFGEDDEERRRSLRGRH
jgi:hypothetical protein